MKITPASTLKDVLNTPVGNDLIEMVAYHAGIPAAVIHNPLVGKMKLSMIPKLLGDKLPMETIEHICNLLNLTPEKVITKNEVDPKWWKESVIYQIYPRSFMDSDGDGIGDLDSYTMQGEYFWQYDEVNKNYYAYYFRPNKGEVEKVRDRINDILLGR